MISPRLLSAVCLSLFCAAPASAASLEAEASSRFLEGAWSSAPRFSATVMPAREEWMDAVGCWTRDGAQAAILGMPDKVCIQRAGVRIAALHDLPFGYGGGMLIEGSPFSGVFWISGGVRMSDGWTLIGSIWSGEGSPSACGRLNKAGLVAEFRIDDRSRPVPGTLKVRGYSYNYAPQCRQPAPAIEIPYSK